MYCIDCGTQITDNSKFCPHCGKKQPVDEPNFKEKIADVIIEREITRQVIEAHKSSLDYQFLKKTIGWYLAWVILHLGILLIASDGIFDGNNMDGSKDFWPTGKYAELRDYDITEFLVYSIFSLAILIVCSMVRSQKSDEVNKATKPDK